MRDELKNLMEDRKYLETKSRKSLEWSMGIALGLFIGGGIFGGYLIYQDLPPIWWILVIPIICILIGMYKFYKYIVLVGKLKAVSRELETEQLIILDDLRKLVKDQILLRGLENVDLETVRDEKAMELREILKTLISENASKFTMSAILKKGNYQDVSRFNRIAEKEKSRLEY